MTKSKYLYGEKEFIQLLNEAKIEPELIFK
jgi:hypothetical protein